MPTQVKISALGTQGAPGLGEATAAYAHSQPVPSAVWTIQHDLGYRPNVTVIDTDGDQVEGEIVHNSTTLLTVTYSAAIAGTAYLS